MPLYHVTCTVTNVSGHDTFEVEASSPQDALDRWHDGEGSVVESDLCSASYVDPGIDDVEEA